MRENQTDENLSILEDNLSKAIVSKVGFVIADKYHTWEGQFTNGGALACSHVVHFEAPETCSARKECQCPAGSAGCTSGSSRQQVPIHPPPIESGGKGLPIDHLLHCECSEQKLLLPCDSNSCPIESEARNHWATPRGILTSCCKQGRSQVFIGGGGARWGNVKFINKTLLININPEKFLL